MSHLSLPFYRLPTARSTQIGNVRVVLDRYRQVYIEGSKVLTEVASGDFLIVTLASEQVYYVKAADYERLRASRKRR
jgi:hypothetical protein